MSTSVSPSTDSPSRSPSGPNPNILNNPLSREGLDIQGRLTLLSIRSEPSPLSCRTFTPLQAQADSPPKESMSPCPYDEAAESKRQSPNQQTELDFVKQNLKDLSEKWDFDFTLAPSGTKKPWGWSEASILMTKIDRYLNRLEKECSISEVRSYIAFLLGQLKSSEEPGSSCNVEYILSELGLIYFYLDKYGFLPCTKYFEAYLFKEITTKLAFLRNSTVNPLPSGINSYILRTFCSMAIDSHGMKNSGAIISVLRLLERGISTCFVEEHYTHITYIFRELLLKEGELSRALQKEVKPHPSMVFIIKFDLKLPSNKKITKQHVRMVCLMALLHNLRQIDRPNCSVVAAMIYVNKEAPAFILNKYQECLKKGTLDLADTSIPLPPLLSKRLLDERELGICLPLDQIKSSIAIQTALLLMNVKIETLELEDRPYTVKDFLKEATKKTEHPEIDYLMAACILGTFKVNALVETMVGAIEFGETNSSPHLSSPTDDSPDVSQLRGVKNNFIHFLKKNILDQVRRTAPDHLIKPEVAEVMEEFEKRLFNTLWLQNQSGRLEQEGENIHLHLSLDTSITIRKFSGDLKKLEQFVLHHRRIVWFKEGVTQTIYTHIALRQFLHNVYDEICKERIAAGKAVPSELSTFLLKGYISGLVSRRLPKFLEKINHSIPLTERQYKRARINQSIPLAEREDRKKGLILFSDDGGMPFEFPLKMLGVQTTKVSFKRQDVNETFFDLFAYLHTLSGKERFLEPNRHILCQSKNHAFTLFPSKFSSLWNENDYRQELQENAIAPMLLLLEQPFSEERKQRVLKEMFRDHDTENGFLNCLKKGMKGQEREALEGLRSAENGNAFRDQFLSSTKRIWHEKFLCALESELTKINCREIPWDLLLGETFQTRSPEWALKVKLSLEHAFQRETNLHSHEAAFLMQKVLTRHRMFLSRTELEKMICSTLKLPTVWILGDLNYGEKNEFSENFLVAFKILPDLAPLLYARMGPTEFPLPSNLADAMEELDIVHR